MKFDALPRLSATVKVNDRASNIPTGAASPAVESNARARESSAFTIFRNALKHRSTHRVQQPVCGHRRNAIGGFRRNQGHDPQSDDGDAGKDSSPHRYNETDLGRRMFRSALFGVLTSFA
jgi:hypothetical protein